MDIGTEKANSVIARGPQAEKPKDDDDDDHIGWQQLLVMYIYLICMQMND